MGCVGKTIFFWDFFAFEAQKSHQRLLTHLFHKRAAKADPIPYISQLPAYVYVYVCMLNKPIDDLILEVIARDITRL